MSQTPNVPKVPVEPPELEALRQRLLTTLAQEAESATGTAKPLLTKMHELLVASRPGEPFNPELYEGVKAAIVDFMKAPVFPPPTVIAECVAFMQERQAVFLSALHGAP
ncbi:hypothetical protein [Melittangium boletus]|uniref:hypothetical protein n=1 Tax=Melittangium boletus TaxID=83453 RepID=UPI003DA5D635